MPNHINVLNREMMEEQIAEQELTHSNGVAVKGGKFLSFFLGNEEYAIEILKVQEIIGLLPITPVPKMPDYVRGVLNLRGKIVPIMNLRVRFGLHTIEDTEETCIIVIQEEKHLMGIVVDKVSEVADLKAEQIEKIPSFGITGNSEYLTGIGKLEDSVKMILDVHKVVFDVPTEVKNANGEPATV
ncbi:MAG: purine-binding chemotaxis protein CheW [Balneolaceae bacterium]|nr:purine-binding chemotaxis protein CheW [Balneolaceae bacterium]